MLTNRRRRSACNALGGARRSRLRNGGACRRRGWRTSRRGEPDDRRSRAQACDLRGRAMTRNVSCRSDAAQPSWEQEQLAAKLYVSRTAVSKWETGGGSPNLDSLQAVARLFDVSVDDLLVYCFRHFSRSGRALYLPFQIWDKGRVEGGGRRTTSWDLALDDRIAPPTRSVTWIRQDGRSGLDI